MKRFVFRLEKVLDLKTYEEKQAQLKLAAKNAECQALELEIQELMSRKVQVFLERGQAQGDFFTLIAYERYGKRLEAQAQKKEELLIKKLVEREHLLKIFLEAQKKRKVLDQIRDKRHALWHTDKKRDDLKKVDDLVSSAQFRKNTKNSQREG